MLDASTCRPDGASTWISSAARNLIFYFLQACHSERSEEPDRTQDYWILDAGLCVTPVLIRCLSGVEGTLHVCLSGVEGTLHLCLSGESKARFPGFMVSLFPASFKSLLFAGEITVK